MITYSFVPMAKNHISGDPDLMKKTELIAAIVEKTGMSKTQAADAVGALTQILTEIGSSGDALTLPGFGTFKGKTRPARTGRNPTTGEAIAVAEKKVLTFKPSTALKL